MIRDIKEFDIVYREAATKMFRRAFSLVGDGEVARDFVQSVFATLWEKRSAVTNPEAFLNEIINRLAIGRYRSSSIQERFTRLYPIEVELLEREDNILSDEINDFIRTNLSPSIRRVVDCVIFQQMSYKDTANELEISVATVNKHMVSALKAMRNHFTNLKKL